MLGNCSLRRKQSIFCLDKAGNWDDSRAIKPDFLTPYKRKSDVCSPINKFLTYS